MKLDTNFIPLKIQFSQYHLKIFLCPVSCLGSLVENQLTINVRIYFGRLIFILLIFVSPYANITEGLPRWYSGKELPASTGDARRRRFNPWVGQILWRRKWQPTPVFLPGKFHGQRSLMGCSPWGCKELDTIEQLSAHIHTCP